MDSVDHPLDWWAAGGYAFVMRETGCTKAAARHAVHKAIADGGPGWVRCPVGKRGTAIIELIYG